MMGSINWVRVEPGKQQTKQSQQGKSGWCIIWFPILPSHIELSSGHQFYWWCCCNGRPTGPSHWRTSKGTRQSMSLQCSHEAGGGIRQGLARPGTASWHFNGDPNASGAWRTDSLKIDGGNSSYGGYWPSHMTHRPVFSFSARNARCSWWLPGRTLLPPLVLKRNKKPVLQT